MGEKNSRNATVREIKINKEREKPKGCEMQDLCKEGGKQKNGEEERRGKNCSNTTETEREKMNKEKEKQKGREIQDLCKEAKKPRKW